MKLLIRESLIAAVLAAAALPTMADDAVEECTDVKEILNSLGASQFSAKLMARGVDFKYGEFTIFAPKDKLLSDSAILLDNDGHTDTTVDDVVLFHVSAESLTEDITDPEHCGKSILMLNEELHVNQESSTTNCDGEKVYQIGPGNTGVMPKVVGEPVRACNGVIYVIEDALMLPTLPDLPVVPTESPPATKPPTRQDSREADPEPEPKDDPEPEPEADPEPEEEDSGSNSLLSYRGSIAFTALAGLIIAIL